MKFTRTLSVVAAAVVASTSLSACSEGTGTGADADPKNIVATTQVWADVAAAVTGGEVEAIISGSSIDPHHFEPSAKDLAQIKEAGTVVANGGHYDESLYTVAEQDRIIHAVELLENDGHDHGEHDHGEHAHGEHDHGEHDHGADITHIPQSIDELEHVWLAPDKVIEVAKGVEERAGGSAADVEKRMNAVKERLHSFKHVHLAMTEPIAAPLVWGTELHDITPEGYLLSALNENEPSASDIAQFLELIDSGNLDFLVVNPQSTNSATERLADAARKKNLLIVEIRETPPDGVNFLDYFEQIVEEIAVIVDKSEPRPDTELWRFTN